MKTNDLWSFKADCCGCELCSQTCPKQIISMRADEEGFLYPHIEDETSCIDCKRCINVCPVKKPGRVVVHIEKSFSFSLPDEKDLQRSASGGIVTAISRAFVQQDGVVYGVTYIDDCRSIKYQRAASMTELENFRGSKYAQAVKGNVYDDIKKDVKDGKKVLFIGLPCEVSAVYHAVAKQDQLYTISLICHGPTSQKVHRDYLASLPNASKKICFMSVRYKKTGWKPYYIHVEYEDGKVYEEQWDKSDYGIAFQYLKRPSCHTCRYKTRDNQFGLQSDMTVGDYHALKKGAPKYNKWGVSQVSIQTEKGRYLASLIQERIEDAVIPNSLIQISNRALHQPIPLRGNRNRFLKDYQGHSLHYATHSFMVKFTDRIIRIGRQLKRVKNIKKLPSKLIGLIRK